VVVASHNARASIEECLASLEAQQPEGGVEIVVVDNSTDGTAEVIRRRFPTIKLVVWPPSSLIPELWEAGIRQSSGDIVAITTAHCVPGKDWLIQMLKAHEAAVPAIGGVIENDDSGGLVDWAIYFCRYNQYMLPCREGFVSEIPGDNASYKRAYIDRCQHVWRNGFWEPAVHAELKKTGLQLLLVPSIIVCHKKSFSLKGFLEQRFQHGMQFGGERASRFSGPKRALYVLLSPAIPIAFLVRISRQVLRKRRHRKEFLRSLPILLLFLLAWTWGELIGYLRGPRG
jgi:glycosyltransferase involved in cell wall biosynthesis